jgi:four helix bundle protein
MRSSKFQARTRSSKFQVPSSKFPGRGFRLAGRCSYAVAPSACELREEPQASGQPPYDLEARTELFGESIVRFAKKVPRGPGNDRLIAQLVGAGTSVGANYAEASEAVSQKDFKYAVSRCVKEAKETRFFLRMIAVAEPDLAGEARKLYREARELHLIFGSMYRKK